jgi:hypothetical protein
MKAVVISEVAAKSQAEVGSIRPGATIRQFIFNEEGYDGLNFKLFRSQFQPGESAHSTPRHHHAFQQIRWSESGSVNYAPDMFIDEGDVAYFPLGAYYGPQLKDQGVTVTLQFGFGDEHKDGGAKGSQLRGEATERLNARGTFANGIYVDEDPETGARRERDAVQALYEEMNSLTSGEAFVVPSAGYEEPILLHTEAFEYYEVDYGVEMKRYGRFYDHPGPHGDVAISRLRISDGGSYTFGDERAQVAWTKSPGLRVDGKVFPELSCIYSARGETLVIESDAVVEVNVAELPRLD